MGALDNEMMSFSRLTYKHFYMKRLGNVFLTTDLYVLRMGLLRRLRKKFANFNLRMCYLGTAINDALTIMFVLKYLG